MSANRFIAGVLVTATLLALPLVSVAGTYMRVGGGAYHSRSTCPALKGYKTVEVQSTAGLTPCRICCQDAYEQAQNKGVEMKLGQPRVLTIQEMSGTHKQDEDTQQQGNTTVFYDGEHWDPIHCSPRGSFVVSNGQPIRVGGSGAAAARAGGGRR